MQDLYFIILEFAIFRCYLWLMAKISMNLDAFWEFHSWSAEKAHFQKLPFLGV